ncbi:MAG: heme NO-binding domain-containing protein [Bacteroidota bacterium]
MKGIVFTEFIDMVESKFGYETVDHIIEASDLESNGIYTSVGTYPHSEIVQLLLNLSDRTKMDAQVLLKAFGEYLFDTFLKSYPQFFTAKENAFEFLKSIDSHIHVEVLKLYPDATLPKFETTEDDNGSLIMTYTSERKMSALAEGLIEKSIEYYGHPHSVEKKNKKEDGSEVEFIIKRV